MLLYNYNCGNSFVLHLNICRISQFIEIIRPVEVIVSVLNGDLKDFDYYKIVMVNLRRNIRVHKVKHN